MYPTFRDLVFERIHHLLKILQKAKVHKKFGDSILNLVKYQDQMKKERDSSPNIPEGGSEPIFMRSQSKDIPTKTHSFKSRGSDSDFNSIYILDPNYSLEKEIMLYLLTELDHSCI